MGLGEQNLTGGAVSLTPPIRQREWAPPFPRGEGNSCRAPFTSPWGEVEIAQAISGEGAAPAYRIAPASLLFVADLDHFDRLDPGRGADLDNIALLCPHQGSCKGGDPADLALFGPG